MRRSFPGTMTCHRKLCSPWIFEEKCLQVKSIDALKIVYGHSKLGIALVLDTGQGIRSSKYPAQPELLLHLCVLAEIFQVDQDFLESTLWRRGIRTQFSLRVEYFSNFISDYVRWHTQGRTRRKNPGNSRERKQKMKAKSEYYIGKLDRWKSMQKSNSVVWEV